jgi:hypothetical protein
MNVDEHLEAFARAFVISAKRDRWVELLTRRGKNVYANSHKLHSALDRRYCTMIADFTGLDDSLSGVYYDFFSPPIITFLKEAAIKSSGDAIFSIHPGRLAIYFFHEDEVWLCRR